jgi:hypothetical protein
MGALRAIMSARRRSVLGVSNFSNVNFFESAIAGGELGVAAGGFGFVFAFFLRRMPGSNTNIPFSRMIASSPYQGFRGYIGNGQIVTNVCAGAAGLSGQTFNLSGNDLGRVHVIACRLTASNDVETYFAGRWQAGALPAAYVAAATISLTLGTDTTRGWFARDLDAISAFTFRGDPTRAQIEATIAEFRKRGDLPDAMAGATIAHRQSVRDELRGTIVVDGQAAPAQLTDTITRAGVDALVKRGAPVVREISSDERRVLGMLGALPTSYFVAAAGIRGAATGFTIIAAIRVDQLPTGGAVGRPIANSYSTVNTGYSFYGINNTISFYQIGTINGQVCTLSTVDVGATMLVAVTWSGATYRGYKDAVQTLADTAGPFAPNTTSEMCVGRTASAASTERNDFCSLFALAGCDEGLTLAELQAVQDNWQKSGKLVLPAGKINPRNYDFTAATVAGGVDAVPAVVPNAAPGGAVDPLVRVGPDATIGAVRGLKINYPLSALVGPPGGGFQGGTTALTVSFLLASTGPVTTINEMFASQGKATFWDFRRGGSAGSLGYPGVVLRTSTGGVQSGQYTYQPGDAGKLMHFAFTWDGAFLIFYANGVPQGAPVALGGLGGTTGLNDPTEQLTIGAQQDGQTACKDFTFVSIGGGNYAATPAEIATQSASSLAGGRLVAIPGRTDDRRYNYDQDAAEQGTPLPGKLIDRTGHDYPLACLGGGLVLAQRKDQLWSYENRPITHGFVMPAAASDAFEAANVQIGNTARSWWLTMIVHPFRTATASNRWIVHKSTGLAGFLGQCSSGSTYNFYAVNNPNMTGLTTPVIAAADLGRIAVLTMMWDEPQKKMRLFYKRAEVGAGTPFAAGYVPDPGNLCWGAARQSSGGGEQQDLANLLGLCGGNYLLSLAELWAQHDAIVASDGAIQAVPYKTAHLWNGRRLAGVSSFVPGVTTIPDEIGGSPMVLTNYRGVAAITRADITARAFAA